MATILRRNLISVTEGPRDYFANTQTLPLLGRRWGRLVHLGLRIWRLDQR